MNESSNRIVLIGCVVSLVGILTISQFIIVPSILQMICYTLPVMYIGSHLTLKQCQSADTELLGHKDAMMFPVYGSLVLFSLFIAFKFFDSKWMNFLLDFYCCIVASLGMHALLEPILTTLIPSEAFVRERSLKKEDLSFPFNYLQGDASGVILEYDWVGIVSVLIGGCVCLTWFITDYWFLHNVMAIVITIQGISKFSAQRFSIATTLLCGLFIYDVFWVFGTNVMMAVATSFRGPLKIIFPLSFIPRKYGLLGLGDMIVPGIFISICLRFDLFLHAEKMGENKLDVAGNKPIRGETVDINREFTKFYFWVVLASYAVGLVTTAIFMFIFKRGQPALLYLVPYCLLSTYGSAILNGQLKDMFSYCDVPSAPEAIAADGASKVEMRVLDKSIKTD